MQRKNGLKSFSIRAIKETTEGANKNARNQKKKKKNKITKQMNLFNVKLMERRRPHTKAVDFNWKTIFILSLLFGQCLTADGNGKRGNRSSKIIHKMTIDNLTATTTTMPWTSKLISRLNATSSLTNDAIQSTKTTDTTTSTSTIPIEKYDALALIQSTKHVKLKLVRDQFRKFVDAFGVQLQNMTIDFDIVDGLSSLIRRLDTLNYTTIFYMLDSNSASEFTECALAQELSMAYQKTLLFWPCPQMKKSERHLPSFETMSYAVKSVALKFNWTEAILFSGDEFGLPLAIAAHLHIPYRIKIGKDLSDLHRLDSPEKLLIITSPLNSPDTLELLNQLMVCNHSKILLIDIVGAIFHKQSEFYRNIARDRDRWLANNLLVLTMLTDKLKRFLNATFTNEYNSIYGGTTTSTLASTMPSMTSSGDGNDASATAIDGDDELIVPLSMTTIGDFEATTTIPSSSNIDSRPQSSDTNAKHALFDAVARLEDDNHFSNFNEIQFRSILSLFRPNFFNENCTTRTMPTADGDVVDRNSTEKSEYHCVANAETLTKCETYLGATIRLFPQLNVTNVRILCQRIADHILKMNNEKSSSEFQSAHATTGDEDSKSSTDSVHVENVTSSHAQEFIHLIPSQSDTKFSEFFSFFDFVVAKLGQLYVENVNYSQSHSAASAGAASQPTHATNVSAFDFCVLDFHVNRFSINASAMATAFVWRPYLILRQSDVHQKLFVTHPLVTDHQNWFFDRSSRFWTCGLLCWILASIVLLLLVCILVAGVTVGLAIRNYLLKKRLSKGPNKIVLSPTDFVFPIDARRVDEGIEAMLCCWLQQLQEFGGPEVDKPDLLKGSIGSLKNLGLANATAASTAKRASGSSAPVKPTPCLDKRARYNGDLVQLKEVSTGASSELKTKAMDHLVMAHGLRHENINPLIGWLADPIRTALVFEYCSRGSLQDVLIMDEIKLDWSFRLSLLTDLVRGMRYLHSSPLRVHGSLTSRNCVVDARWVLKITDYGLNQFYEAQGIPLPPKNAKQLLWTAPELLRNSKGHSKCGTQAGDVFSFGIIIQEVVVRGEPYCMLSLSAEEIISKIKKPPPLIRPSVSKGAAPPEAINIMRQCWAEQPELRPDFNAITERFKQLNQGRKVNFVDTMFQMLEKYSNNLEELIRERTDQLDIERKKTEQLLNRMLPSSVAEKLKVGLCVEPEEFSDVTIYFSDIVGFTTIAAYCTPVQVVDLLNDLYTCFDATINAYSVYKVETIGDAYMVVSGLPVRIPDHAEQIATMALDLLHQSGRFKIKHLPEVPLQLRIGLHTGPCCAGVVGLTMPRYCLFGDTVNTASRMESYGSSWRIHMSEATRDRLEKSGRYFIEPRGPIEIKGKGPMNTYWLLGKKGFEKVLPSPPQVGESHGLDETLVQHCIRSKQRQSKTPCISATHSSSQSSSLAGEPVDVKVEITPPRDIETTTTQIPNSYSVDSSATMNLSINLSDYKVTPSTSPQQRKMSELTTTEGLLNTSNFGRLTPSSAGGSSCKLYKKFEELMDLSSPYNHYRCLSPSESNLTQCHDGKYIYGINKLDNKPGSSRLLRRQFSLDKDDCQTTSTPTSTSTSTISTVSQIKSTNLDIPSPQDPNRQSPSPTNIKPGRLHKQTSASVAQDLEKIEEIPISPTSCSINYRHDLTQIPGSTNNSPAQKKPDDQIRRTSVDDIATTSNNNSNNNNANEISLNVQSLILR